MIKHIVLFKLKEEIGNTEKMEVMNQFKLAIEALPTIIPIIRKIEVGLNMNPAEKWDIALYSEFASMDDLKAYAIHPAHVEAAKLLASVKDERSCVDYEV